MRLRDMNPVNMPGPGDLSNYADPQNACDCEDGCFKCDPEMAAEARAEANYDY